MNRQDSTSEQDKRVLVLLVLGAGILLAGWFTPVPELRTSNYYQLHLEGEELPVVGRTVKNQDSLAEPDGIILSAQTSCADTPPQLALFFNLPLPVNRADFQSLTMLPSIGNQRAQDIIGLRNQLGRISGPEDLTKVDGIGDTLAKRLSSMICFD